MSFDAPADRDAALRAHLLELLDGGAAHATLADALAAVPADRRGDRVPGQSHTPWRLAEHVRIAQRDILDFCRDPAHRSPEWPGGYWPDADAPPAPAAWPACLHAIAADAAAFRHLIADPAADLLAPIPGGDGQTLAREAMLLADHNAYHAGQLATLAAAILRDGARA